MSRLLALSSYTGTAWRAVARRPRPSAGVEEQAGRDQLPLGDRLSRKMSALRLSSPSGVTPEEARQFQCSQGRRSGEQDAALGSGPRVMSPPWRRCAQDLDGVDNGVGVQVDISRSPGAALLDGDVLAIARMWSEVLAPWVDAGEILTSGRARPAPREGGAGPRSARGAGTSASAS